jgi:murein L,D-transpeptidase YcbB/YkuD
MGEVAVRSTVRSLALICSVAAAGLLSTTPAASQTPPPSAPVVPAPVAADVPPDIAGFYQTYAGMQIWLRNGTDSAAIHQLISILQRAPFDGYPEGVAAAARVQAALAQAGTSPAAKAAAEQTLSAAWVRYVQALKQPTAGMIYAYPVLKPQGTKTRDILLSAAAAPSLEQYLTSTAALNPVYSQLRDIAWAEAQASGNMTPDPRLLANLDRARSIPSSGRFLLVDSGSQRLTLYDDGKPLDSMKVIVGTDQLPTPLISSIMYYVTYNPYWHAPDHLVRKTIAPTVLKQGFGYLKSHGYHVIEAWSATPTMVDPTKVDWKGAAAGTTHLLVQQDPGPLNSMGRLKFPFPNPEDIYLHDTPNKALFAKDVRFLSNGCVRVEDAPRLGRWLLGQDPKAPSADPELAVQIPKGVPIVLTYLTAQVKDGKLAYVPDVYGWDKAPPTQFVASTSTQ